MRPVRGSVALPNPR